MSSGVIYKKGSGPQRTAARYHRHSAEVSLSQVHRWIIHECFHGIGFLYSFGFLIIVYHIFPQIGEQNINISKFFFARQTAVANMGNGGFPYS